MRRFIKVVRYVLLVKKMKQILKQMIENIINRKEEDGVSISFSIEGEEEPIEVEIHSDTELTVDEDSVLVSTRWTSSIGEGEHETKPTDFIFRLSKILNVIEV